MARLEVIPKGFYDHYELAEVLAEKHNLYFGGHPEFDELTPASIIDVLREIPDEEIEHCLTDEFGHGYLLGTVICTQYFMGMLDDEPEA